MQINNAIARFRPNVISFAGATYDLGQLDPNDYAGLEIIRDNLANLIAYASGQCQNCAVLVGDVPTTGDFVWPPSPEQKQRLQFNALLSNLVNEQQTRYGRHVMKVHFSPANGDVNSQGE